MGCGAVDGHHCAALLKLSTILARLAGPLFDQFETS